MANTGKARAYTNIALIKYWGKKDDDLILPMNSSLSLTLDAFYTETTVHFDATLKEDQFYLNQTLQNPTQTKKTTRFLDLVRQEAGITTPAIIESTNYVPTAAGLASSASGFAALAGAASLASGLELDSQALSRLARRGSGSATRSIYGGFVEWQMGSNDLDSYGVPIDDASSWDLAMLFVVVNQKEKVISSRDGMKQTVATSPFYSGWLESTAKDLITIKEAIKEHDFQKLGETMESNGLKMHATMLGATPPFTYWEPDSIQAMQFVAELRQEGIPCYFTMDAGPNVKVLCHKSDLPKIKAKFATIFQETQLITAYPGPGIQLSKGDFY
ncbi:diphosphomevalonate decarboxylase [Carnobacterium maltaromaticum]|uniref:diphosphomevalonate decarboxylase n=1 Tax=Carnobacterium maltaromaticum TaxID=2751 RepID=UPI001D9C3C29|nr:diphosphomevalonate decarboxylase [Carnobacterium maltaromaticum]MCC4311599.1 diphosphomevalonate decarboxylase [Carnobacterium maltaromaticum]MDW5523864.1 diphosphomevalonate decarboxylase [Carnobacterium maltaromaticum]